MLIYITTSSYNVENNLIRRKSNEVKRLKKVYKFIFEIQKALDKTDFFRKKNKKIIDYPVFISSLFDLKTKNKFYDTIASFTNDDNRKLLKLELAPENLIFSLYGKDVHVEAYFTQGGISNESILFSTNIRDILRKRELKNDFTNRLNFLADIYEEAIYNGYFIKNAYYDDVFNFNHIQIAGPGNNSGGKITKKSIFYALRKKFTYTDDKNYNILNGNFTYIISNIIYSRKFMSLYHSKKINKVLNELSLAEI